MCQMEYIDAPSVLRAQRISDSSEIAGSTIWSPTVDKLFGEYMIYI